MTAPTAIADVLSRVAAIQNQINTLAGVKPTTSTTATASTTAAASSSTSGASGTDFSSLLSQLNGSSDATGGPGATDSTSTATGDAAVSAAESYLGTPYVWGGESSTGIDCSGLTQASYKSLGISLPRTAAEQQKVGTAVDSIADAKPGDLIFYGNPAHHVTMYIGNNKLIEAPTEGQSVHIKTVYGHPSSIRRVVSDSSVSSGYSSATSPAVSGTGLNAAVMKYSAQFKAAETKYGLPTGLLAAVAQQESGGNTSAMSKAGAVGLMQFMPSTAAGLGVDPLNPSSAIDGAGRMYAGLLSKYSGSVPLALAAYNAGSGAVDKYGGIPPYSETQNYVKKVTALMTTKGAQLS
ncbi:cell wall-associated NlpC family hydrolase [Jatrophihabitans sp. GAS493]|uniref:NlpC/P60 family protein n=1 Tax=Jatrophihabitans sp. GAS493 TaxID=1907575 RepID=UPI000BB6FBCE|nr:NlpC/P60 family protein [Jatrophihabitans sp. GAS493]SOD71333.1 cell wall-associated NlpC family hydrolase [Jatrophihabitans sp. GAS493]